MIRESGEAAFRALETEAVRETGKLSGKIIATGGGVPTIRENYDLLHQNGVIIWLERAIEFLPTAGRPISQGRKLSDLYAERKPAYTRFADCRVKGKKDPKETAKSILSAFEKSIQ